MVLKAEKFIMKIPQKGQERKKRQDPKVWARERLFCPSKDYE